MKKYIIIKSAIYIIAAILILIFNEKLVQNLKYLISGALLMFGIFDAFYGFVDEEKFYQSHNLYFGLLEIFLGIVMLIKLDTIDNYQTICVVWAVWSIFRETFEIKELVERFKNKIFIPSIISLSESIVVIVLSTIMLIEPEAKHVVLHTYLLVIEFVISSIIPISNFIFDKKHKNTVKKHGSTKRN